MLVGFQISYKCMACIILFCSSMEACFSHMQLPRHGIQILWFQVKYLANNFYKYPDINMYKPLILFTSIDNFLLLSNPWKEIQIVGHVCFCWIKSTCTNFIFMDGDSGRNSGCDFYSMPSIWWDNIGTWFKKNCASNLYFLRQLNQDHHWWPTVGSYRFSPSSPGLRESVEWFATMQDRNNFMEKLSFLWQSSWQQ